MLEDCKSIIAACEEGPGLCAHLITALCLVLIVLSLPLSLCLVVKVVQVASLGLSTPDILIYSSQEYERDVIFRLGRLLSGGARGPGVFFVIPCVDMYEKIDMRTQTFDVPPQEVKIKSKP